MIDQNINSFGSVICKMIAIFLDLDVLKEQNNYSNPDKPYD